LWAARALKFGYRWKIGDGTKIHFWEDTWFATAPLAVHFWDLYCICDQVGVTLATVWDGSEVKLSFRRTFSEAMLIRWYELVEIVSGVNFEDDSDALVWQYDSKGIYTSQSLYVIINFRGVTPIFHPCYLENQSTTKDPCFPLVAVT